MRRIATIVSVLILLVTVGQSISAQSVSLPFSESGTFLRSSGSLGTREGFGVQVGAGYSISGVLDIGLRFGADIAPADGAVTSDIGMTYSFAALKQADDVPLSAQLYGAYTFRAEDSDFLTRNQLLQEARGYSLGVALVRDIYVGPSFAFRISALAEYSNYTEITTVGFDPTGFTGSAEVDYTEYPLERRQSGFFYGGYLGLAIFSQNRTGIQLGAAVLADPYANLEVRPDLQILLTR